MHIALLSNHLHVPFTGFGGIERWSQHLANGFVDAGHRVTLLANAPMRSTPAHHDLDPRVAVVSLGTRSWVATARGRLWLARERPDVLLTASHRYNLMGAGMTRPGGRPLWIASVHEHMGRAAQQLPPARQARRRREVQRCYSRAAAVVAVSAAVAQDLRENWGLAQRRVECLHNPIVDAGWLRRADDSPAHPWLLDSAVPVVLAAGRLSEEKGFDDLLRAFALLRARRPCRLVILGQGKQREPLLALARQLGIDADVALPGHVDSPAPSMARARLFVLSSLREGFANVIPEALSLGTPVVSTDCESGPAEILDHGRWGRLTPVGDVAALADAMADSLDRQHDPAALRARGSQYSVARSVGSYLRLFEDLGAGNA